MNQFSWAIYRNGEEIMCGLLIGFCLFMFVCLIGTPAFPLGLGYLACALWVTVLIFKQSRI
jgi:hypothetical protein